MCIISDETWIPWEIVKPYGDDKEDCIIDDDFLGIQFQLTRWMKNTRLPPSSIHVQRLVCLEIGAPLGLRPLPVAREEKLFVEQLAEGTKARIFSPARINRGDLLKIVRKDKFDLLHFVGYGDFETTRPYEASIVTTDGERFYAKDLIKVPNSDSQIEQNHPFVFIDASAAGFGWAEAWIHKGCGCFVGPQWLVSDEKAFEFTRRFYLALKKEQLSFGQAANTARRHMMRFYPRDLIWPAFAVFGHPNGRLRF